MSRSHNSLYVSRELHNEVVYGLLDEIEIMRAYIDELAQLCDDMDDDLKSIYGGSIYGEPGTTFIKEFFGPSGPL